MPNPELTSSQRLLVRPAAIPDWTDDLARTQGSITWGVLQSVLRDQWEGVAKRAWLREEHSLRTEPDPVLTLTYATPHPDLILNTTPMTMTRTLAFPLVSLTSPGISPRVTHK